MTDLGPPPRTEQPNSGRDRSGTILDVREVVKTFGGLVAVDRADLTVERGSITALIGPNGAGKSTLFNVVTGFAPPEGGTVRFADRTITRMAAHQVAKLGLVRTFQLTKVFEAMSVLDNLLVSGTGHPGEHLLNPFLRVRSVRRHEDETRERSQRLLETFDLVEKRHDYAGELSGGQRKLLELARVLMLRPQMVMLDEPMSGVNPTLGRRLLDHIHRLREEEGTTFLFVEHDMDIVMNHADEVVVMADGKVIASGLPQDVRADPAVLEAYLGTGTSAGAEGR